MSANEDAGMDSDDDLMLESLSSPPGTCDPLCSVDELSSSEYETASDSRRDLVRASGLGAILVVAAAAINHDWVAEHQSISMVTVFILGYMGVVFEESLAFNKSGVALLMSVALWVIHSLAAPSGDVSAELTSQCAEVAEIVFFLMGAMTIVEIVDAHQGFRLVTDAIRTRSPRKLMWLVGGITFVLSSILDNLTSTIVMVSLLRKLVPNPDERKFLGAVVVIAANSGGAWTPIGDVTTTMLWIHGQITTVRTMQDLLIPSIVSLVVPLTLLSFSSSIVDAEKASSSSPSTPLTSDQIAPRGRLVFAVGVGSLLFVPLFKSLTGLPPYLGMLGGVGVVWLLTDAIHYGEDSRRELKVPQALSRIDTQGVLFFLGILLSVGSLDSAGLLTSLSQFLDSHVSSVPLIAGSIGLASAVIDNVPLVAGTMGMYTLAQVPPDAELWQLVAYCAGTGGSILVIGSAAGVAFMGMEKVDFFWYMKKVSGVALAGYAAGMATYLASSHWPEIIGTVTTTVGWLPQNILPF